jgi:membrane-associated protease RseP (regulator of RpoE activity)
MTIASENIVTMSIVLLALGILGWGYYRARPFGKLGILAWLQSVVLMTPWLLLFGLFAAGIYLNIVGILLILVSSTALYIYLGKQLRAAGLDAILRSKAEKAIADQEAADQSQKTEEGSATNLNQEKVITLRFPLTKQIVPLSAEELKNIQGIFGIDTFFATETMPYQEGAVFKGNLRGEPDKVYAKLSGNLEAKYPDRFRLFLVANQEEKPVIVVLPKGNDPESLTVTQKVIALILLVLTLVSCLDSAGAMRGFDIFNNPLRYGEALPIALGIFSILILHEIGHQVMAKRHNVKFSLPFFIPFFQIGSLGSVNRFESILPNRKVLFDVALAGPAAGGIYSFLLLTAGFLLSHPGSGFTIPSDYFQGSILVGTLAKIFLGSGLTQATIEIHPLTVIGWLGLIITAINLMPAGQLDGGRIVQSIYGRKIAGRTTIVTIAILLLGSFISPLSLYWAVVILLLQRNLERPSLNEITEPDDTRAALCLLALFLMIATLLPLTPALAGRLGIG